MCCSHQYIVHLKLSFEDTKEEIPHYTQNLIFHRNPHCGLKAFGSSRIMTGSCLRLVHVQGGVLLNHKE